MPVRIFAVRRGTDELERPKLEELSRLLEDEDVYLWIDIERAAGPEATLLGELLGLHPLLVEDILNEAHPKLEDHGDHLYLILHGLHPENEGPEGLRTAELDLVLARRWIATHQGNPVLAISKAMADLERDPSLLGRGPAFLAHAIIDAMTDRYLPLMERFDQVLDQLELDILRDPTADALATILDLKHGLLQVRRIGQHQRQILHRLASGDVALIPDELTHFFRDVDDHFTRAMDLTDGFRDQVSNALDVYLSMQSHRMNDIMRLLTVISTIMLPMTFVTSLYGMNFDSMPELHWRYGYLFAWGAMLAVALGGLAWVKRHRWL